MSRNPTSPFAALLGTQPKRLPKSAGVAVVIDGRRVTDARQLTAIPEADDDAETVGLDAVMADQAKAALAKARNAAKYQKERQNPEAMAKRQAWQEANRDKRRAYKKKWDARNRPKVLRQKREHRQRAYRADPAAAIKASRDYYARNRDAILARAKAKRDAAKAAKAASLHPINDD